MMIEMIFFYLIFLDKFIMYLFSPLILNIFYKIIDFFFKFIHFSIIIPRDLKSQSEIKERKWYEALSLFFIIKTPINL